MILTLDLGGTRVKAGVFEDGRLIRHDASEVPQSGGIEGIRQALVAAADAVGVGAAPDAVAMCAPGLHERDTVVALPGKLDGLEGVHLPTLLRETFGVDRTATAHDAAAYAIGETVAGAGRGSRRVVVVTIGTGVGVTVIENGRPLGEGVWGAGKLGGFVPIAEDGPEDSNGTRGTIESLCASQQIVACAGDRFDSVPAVYEAVAAGDSEAARGIATYRARLARALIALAHAHGPDRLVLGGGPMHQGAPVFDGVEEAVNAALFRGYVVEVRPAELGDAASLHGLAFLMERAEP